MSETDQHEGIRNMSETDQQFLSALTKIELATRIWKEKRESEYEDAERLHKQAVEIRNKHFP